MSTKKYLHTDVIGDRLKQFRISKSYKVMDFSKLLGISQGSLSGLENNKSKPSAETLANLVLHTDINMKWLLTGQGSMEQAKDDTCGEQHSGNDVVDYGDIKDSEHLKLIKQFNDKDLIKKITQNLLKLEKIDTSSFKEIDEIIKLKIKLKINDDSESSKVNGRKGGKRKVS